MSVPLTLMPLNVPAVCGVCRFAWNVIFPSVLETVAAKYPNAKFTHFAKEVEGDKIFYEVVLENGAAHAEVSVSPEGEIVSEETTIALEEVPTAVANGLAASRYGKAKVVRVERVSAAGKATTFEFLVELSGKKHELVLDQDGKFARSE